MEIERRGSEGGMMGNKLCPYCMVNTALPELTLVQDAEIGEVMLLCWRCGREYYNLPLLIDWGAWQI